MFCRGYEVESSSRFWTRFWILSLVEIWLRFVFEFVIWPQEVTLVRWTQSSGPLCIWQCLSHCMFLPLVTCNARHRQQHLRILVRQQGWPLSRRGESLFCLRSIEYFHLASFVNLTPKHDLFSAGALEAVVLLTNSTSSSSKRQSPQPPIFSSEILSKIWVNSCISE